jgi:hypothetical protein
MPSASVALGLIWMVVTLGCLPSGQPRLARKRFAEPDDAGPDRTGTTRTAGRIKATTLG